MKVFIDYHHCFMVHLWKQKSYILLGDVLFYVIENLSEINQGGEMLPINTLFYNRKQVSIGFISNFINSEQKMNQKTWLPRKRLIALNSEAAISTKGNEEEKLPYNKEAALEETIKNLHEQVACLLCECNTKDELMAELVKTTQEAITGRKKAEAEVAIWKQELEEMLLQNEAANESFVQLNTALKICRQQLSAFKLDQDQRVNLEKAHKRLESKYIELRKKVANLTIENARLTKSLINKEEIIENVSNQISKATSEYLLLKRELKKRTLNADVANRQHQESEKLEVERQRLRLLVKTRVPKTKSVDKQLSLMMKKFSEVEEENRRLKESLCEKENEIRVLKGETERNTEEKILDLETGVKRVDEFENLKLINVDLEHQLSGAKVEIKEALSKVSFLEMELDDKSQQYESLETTCLELQLQLASVLNKNEVSDCEGLETRKLSNNKLGARSSLRDHMAADDGSFRVKDVVPQALSIVPRKKHVKGTELLMKLLFRRKKAGNMKKLRAFAIYNV